VNEQEHQREEIQGKRIKIKKSGEQGKGAGGGKSGSERLL